MRVSARDIDTLSRTIYGEARDQPYFGKLAVAMTVIERVKLNTWYGKTIYGVCMKPYQYSCWSKKPWNRANLRSIKNAHLGLAHFRDCARAALEVTQRNFQPPEFMRGVTHYHTHSKPGYADTWPPDWTKPSKLAFQIADHVFYHSVP